MNLESKYRNYCFTAYKEPVIMKDSVTFFIYQKECCPSTKKIHWQGYIELKKQMRYNEVKNLFCDNTLHLEPRYGTQKQAIEYCKKGESRMDEPVVYGVPKNQGNRSDLDSIYDSIEAGCTAKEILREHGGKAVKYINMIIKSLQVEHDCCAIDKIILLNRQYDNASEVGGNTEPPTSESLEVTTEKHYEIKDEVKKLSKIKKVKI